MKQWLVRSAVVLLALAVGVALAVWLLWIPAAQEAPYTFVRSWGTQGEQAGEFHDPTGLAVTANEVFVSDARNGRIQVFSYDGEPLRIIGESGDGPGQLGRPMNLVVHGDQLYVADYWNDRITVFSLDGAFVRNIGSAGQNPAEFKSPGGVALDNKGALYVADFGNHRIQKLSAEGEFIRQWGTSGTTGVAAGEFSYPTDVVVDDQGRLFVADGYNDRVQVFDAAGGEPLYRWGGPFAVNIHGQFPGWFATVTSIAIGPVGSVWTADFYNHRVQKFTADGRFLTAFGERGSGPGQFEYASAVAEAPDGTVFATDFGNHRVTVWRSPESGSDAEP